MLTAERLGGIHAGQTGVVILAYVVRAAADQRHRSVAKGVGLDVARNKGCHLRCRLQEMELPRSSSTKLISITHVSKIRRWADVITCLKARCCMSARSSSKTSHTVGFASVFTTKILPHSIIWCEPTLRLSCKSFLGTNGLMSRRATRERGGCGGNAASPPSPMML